MVQTNRKIRLETTFKKLLADVFTPVGIYLRLRDRFRDTILLESSDHHAAENSFSFICINAVAGIEIIDVKNIEFKLPGNTPERTEIKNVSDVPRILWEFMQKFDVQEITDKVAKTSQSLFGYTTYDAIQFLIQ